MALVPPHDRGRELAGLSEGHALVNEVLTIRRPAVGILRADPPLPLIVQPLSGEEQRRLVEKVHQPVGIERYPPRRHVEPEAASAVEEEMPIRLVGERVARVEHDGLPLRVVVREHNSDVDPLDEFVLADDDPNLTLSLDMIVDEKGRETWVAASQEKTVVLESPLPRWSRPPGHRSLGPHELDGVTRLVPGVGDGEILVAPPAGPT